MGFDFVMMFFGKAWFGLARFALERLIPA